MSQVRKIRRSIDRLLNAGELVMLSASQPVTQSSRMAVAGNTGSGLRRKAVQVIEQAERLYKPEDFIKVIQHSELFREEGIDGDAEYRERAQTITGRTRFKRPDVHSVAMYGARQLAERAAKAAESAAENAATAGSK